jgi:hypothetical protein
LYWIRSPFPKQEEPFMDNLVGEQIPSEPEVKKQVQQLQEIAKRSEGWAVKLYPERRRQLLKFRPGGERVVERVARLAQKYSVDSDDTPVEGMLADLMLAQRLQPLVDAARILSGRYADTVLEAQAECWHAATALYTLLKARARDNRELAAELDEVTKFFAIGRRRPKPPATGSAA